MNIEDLKEYVAAMKAEIERVEAKIKAKQSHAVGRRVVLQEVEFDVAQG